MTEEQEFKFYSRIVFAVAAVVISLIVSVATYNTVDRTYQGHAVIVSPQTVISTK